MKLLIATGNPSKVKEFKRILEPLGIELVTPKELGVVPEVEENGTTFIENSKLKAEELFEKTGIPTVADDSGLCIVALGGRPGIHTARYGNTDDYNEKFNLIFSEMNNSGTDNRDAEFVCSICCILDNDRTIEVTETCKGEIGFEAKGEDGFGYDPIFYIGERSFAEHNPEEKDAISHRGKALRKFAELLKKELKTKGEIL